MRSILEYFRVKKSVQYHGTMENLESILKAMEDRSMAKETIRLYKTDHRQYLLKPRILNNNGIIQPRGILYRTSEEILTVHLHSKNRDLQEIQLIGSTHWSHLVIFFGFLLGLLGALYSLIWQGKSTGLIFVAILWPLCHLGFNAFWTSREKELVKKFQRALHIRIRMGIGLN